MIQIDMEMPSCCVLCPIYNGEYGKCNLLDYSFYEFFYYENVQSCDPFEERHKECPIKEIKE